MVKEILEKFQKVRIIRFLIVGGCSTGIDFVLYYLLSSNLPITISKAISMITSSVFSYFANKIFTFGNKEKTDAGYLVRFYIVFLLNLGTNIGVNSFLFHVSGHKFIAFIFATAAGMTVNYLGQRFFVFRKNLD